MTNTLQKITNCTIGKNTIIHDFVNLYGCTIGESCKIGPFVEIQKNVVMENKVKIGSHSFICEGVYIEDNVFIGHGVMFTNDKFPRSVNTKGQMQSESDWQLLEIKVKKNASIGSNATILGGVVIGENAIIGAGSVVVSDVPDNVIVAGNPAKILRKLT